MKTKMTYIAPETEMIDLKLEQGILTASEPSIRNIEGDDVVDNSSSWS